MLHQAILISAAFSMILTAAPVFAQDKGAAPGNPKGSIWDDGQKPLAPNSSANGAVSADGLKPQNPAVNPQGTIWDDTVKPVSPKP